MKARIFLSGAMAVLALAGCNKKQAPAGTATNQTVNVTTANPPAGGTWADVVNETTSGFIVGNPNAKVKLVEIGSLSCPHCKKFDDEGVPVLLDKYVKTGQVSWEFRPYVIHGQIDVAADIIARCNGIKTFFPLVQSLYKDQESWLGKVEKVPQDQLQKIQSMPVNQQFVAMANILGLQDYAAARGVPQAKSNQCLSDQKMIDHEVQVASDVSNQYPEFSGTPTFVINGKMLPNPPVGEWAQLKPKLDEALK